jgi:molybdopterin-guanine dinucleotide biosynthesis protein A
VNFTAAILAGGQGRRLGGRDKSALVIGGGSILDRQIAALRGLTPHVLVVGSTRVRDRRADAVMVTDGIAGAGALGGLYTALVTAPTEQVLVIACDMPFLDAPFLTYLASRGEDVEAAMPRDAQGRHPLCASYHRGVAGRLRARIVRGELRVLDAVAELDVRDIGPDELAPFDPDGTLLMNVNTPQDHLAAVQEGTASSRSGRQPTPPGRSARQRTAE